MKSSYVAAGIIGGILVLGAGSIVVAEKHLSSKIDENVKLNISKFNSSQKVLHVNIDSQEDGLFSQSYKTSITANNNKVLGVNFDIAHGIGSVFSGKADLTGSVNVEAQVATLLGLSNGTIATLSGSSSGNKIDLAADVVAIKPKVTGEALSISSFKIGGSAQRISEDNANGSFFIKNLKVNASPKSILPMIPVASVKLDLNNFSTDFSLNNSKITSQKVNLDIPEIFASNLVSVKGARADLDVKFEKDRLNKTFEFNLDRLDVLDPSVAGIPRENIRMAVKTSADMPFSQDSVESLLNIGQLLSPTKETKEFWQKGITYKVDKFEVSYPSSKVLISGDLNVVKSSQDKKFSFANNATVNANLEATGEIAHKIAESIPNVDATKDIKVALNYKNGKATSNPVIAEINSGFAMMVDQLDVTFGFSQPTVQSVQAPGIQMPTEQSQPIVLQTQPQAVHDNNPNQAVAAPADVNSVKPLSVPPQPPTVK